ncbi:MAG: hypothetical protein HQK69_08525, partial [Desulfamplus sp.]|nr:hypothetical protein [Desulfamplus sp.]
MNKRNNKSQFRLFILTLAVALIFIIKFTALSWGVANVQADTLPVNADNFIITSNLPIAIIISREIKPFIEMVEGFESSVDYQVVRIFIDQNGNPFSHDPLYKGTKVENYSFVIAVGPSALSYIINNNLIDNVSANSNKDKGIIVSNNSGKNQLVNSDVAKKILYAMVLNPESIIPKNVSICGISLNLFSEETISKITQIFPSVKKIGVLFDPANNSEWFKSAQNSGMFKNVKAIPLHIKEQSDVNNLNQKNLSGVDSLLF